MFKIIHCSVTEELSGRPVTGAAPGVGGRLECFEDAAHCSQVTAVGKRELLLHVTAVCVWLVQPHQEEVLKRSFCKSMKLQPQCLASSIHSGFPPRVTFASKGWTGLDLICRIATSSEVCLNCLHLWLEEFPGPFHISPSPSLPGLT